MPPRGGAPAKHVSAQLEGQASPVRRPRTSPGFLLTGSRKLSVQQAVSHDDEPYAEEEDEADQIELLEYEWPDLPPIPSMKDAVSRRRVSQGISYLLPVDKGRNSINNRFRTDLRAMFQEPYASDDLQYDDNRVQLSAKVHFLSNTADTKWTRELLTSIPTLLNADCEGARKLYVHSAPAGGASSRRMGIDPSKLRKRSNLFLPVKATKAQVSPEIVRLREEAAEIIKQGLAYNEDGYDNGAKDKKNPGASGHTSNHVLNGLFVRHDSEFPSSHAHAQNGGAQDGKNRHHQNNNNLNNSQQQQQQQQQQHNPMLATFGGSHLSDTLGQSSLDAKLQFC
ncbi:uncharacterized protein LOC106013154 [Aplysia californica]|uniref:Uncharacterized protein LOC106013154 n=1 Tax=Aplysia californica TaxID=6500 RepID=A0ABM1A9V1_APLCA|nr:uncharacterized protein LOC106013154 [Aplysia californica]